jgi:hypothetical protein
MEDHYNQPLVDSAKFFAPAELREHSSDKPNMNPNSDADVHVYHIDDVVEMGSQGLLQNKKFFATKDDTVRSDTSHLSVPVLILWDSSKPKQTSGEDEYTKVSGAEFPIDSNGGGGTSYKESGVNHLQSSTGWTSMTSKTPVDPSLGTVIDPFVSLLLENDQLKALCTEGIASGTIGPEKFEHGFRRLLRSYGTDLKGEVEENNDQQQAAACFFGRSSRYAATQARQYCDENFQGGSLVLTGDLLGALEKEEKLRFTGKDDNEGIFDDKEFADGEKDRTQTHLAAVKDFLTKGPPVQTLCCSLAYLVYPTAEAQLVRFFQDVLTFKQKYGIEEKDVQRLQSFLADIATTNAYDITVLGHYEQSSIEKIQRYIETQTTTEWDWWPLAAPRNELRDMFSFVKFRCVSLRGS